MDKVIKQMFSYLIKATTSLLNLYAKHQWYQFVLLIPMIIVAFIYGRSQQNKQLETVLVKLNNTDQYKVDITKERGTITSRLRKAKYYFKSQLLLLGTLLVLTLIYYLTSVSDIFKLNLQLVLMVYTGVLGVIGVTFLVMKWLGRKNERLGKEIQNVYEQEKKDVKTIEKYLGDKVVEKLKRRFLKSLRVDEEIKSKQPCKKKNCTSKIKIYTKSFEFFDQIIKGMITYDWCEFCKGQLETERKKLHQQSLLDIKVGGKSLDDIKRFFNSLLQYYSTKVQDLDKVCKNQCCKQFYQILKTLSEQHYKEYKIFDQQLKLLK